MSTHHYCTVWDAGSSSVDQDVLINLEGTGGPDGVFDGRWFKADMQQRKEFLAAALTAMSAGLRVYVELEDKDVENSRIIRLYATRR